MDPTTTVYDLLGVGLGPASLACAIALAEHNASPGAGLLAQQVYSSVGKLSESLADADGPGRPSVDPASGVGQRSLRVCFLEAHAAFDWHPGMMLDGSRMQISFLKDLATLRNPSSPYTFLNHLHSFTPSRLVSFISLAQFAPTRREYAAYMKWAAKKVQAELEASGGEFGFGERVEKVEGIVGADAIKVLKVTSRSTATGEIRTRYARNLIVSTGGSPRIPREFLSPSIKSTGRLVHTSAFLFSMPTILADIVKAASTLDRPIRVAVIGGGQSGSETFLATRAALNKLLPTRMGKRPEVDLYIRRSALRPADDSPFSNEVFDPSMSQRVFELEGGDRDRLLKEARGTNYAVSNPKTLDAIFEAMYAQQVDENIIASEHGDAQTSINLDSKLTIHPYSNIFHAAAQGASTITLSVEHVLTRKSKHVEYDVVLLGTGYDRQSWKDILFAETTGEKEETQDVKSFATLFKDPHRADSSVSDSPAFSPPTSRGSSIGGPHDSSDDVKTDFDGLSVTDISPRSPHHERHDASTVPVDSSGRGRVPGSLEVSPAKAVDFKISKSYRLELPSEVTVEGTVRAFKPTVWLQGCNEATHGISDSLLSVLAVRSGEVVNSLLREGSFA